MKQSSPEKRSWWHKRHVVLGLCVALGLIIVVFVQLLYPTGKALPYARLGASQVGGQDFRQVIETIRSSYANVELRVKVPGKPDYVTTSSEAGIVPAYRQGAQEVTEYTLPARLVPFSFVYKMLRTPGLAHDIDETNFSSFAAKLADYCKSAPRDASLVFEKGDVRLVGAVNGQECPAPVIRQSVVVAALRPGKMEIAVQPKVVAPKHPDSELRSQLATATATIDAGLTVKSPRDSWPVPRETVASWMTTVEVDGYTALDVKMDAVKAYLETLRGALYVEPGVTKITYLDGAVTSQVAGTKGQGIDMDVSAERIKAVLLGGPGRERVAWVQLAVLEPRVATDWTYTASEKGLQALIEQWERTHPARYGLMVRDLSGKGMNAEYNGDRDFVTASTFKMFLAYAVLHKVEEGQISMESQTDMGLTARACIEEMILHSTNACALSLFNLVGWDYVHDFIRGQFPNTSLKNSANADNEKHTTVRDETSFFIKLNAGQLMNSSNTSYLLDLFKRQVYRSGIPKGVPGITVANKVGFYNGYKHDVGLVYAPRGTYVLGFMSLGGNDGQIADLSRQVYELLNR
jgi:beta-lactamase class A